jgi:hypothetical protein
MAITKATASSIAPAAKGDLVVGSATNDASVLAVGSANQVLTVDSSTSTGLKWAAATDSWVKITSGTISASAATDIDSVFTSTYKHYVITLDNLSGSSATADLQIQFRTTVPGTYASNYYGGALKLIYNSSTPVNINHNAEPYVLATQDIGGSGGSGILFITASNTSAFNPSVQGFLASHNSAINTMPNVTTDPINAGGIRISVNTGTFSTNYIIYGVTQ